MFVSECLRKPKAVYLCRILDLHALRGFFSCAGSRDCHPGRTVEVEGMKRTIMLICWLIESLANMLPTSQSRTVQMVLFFMTLPTIVVVVHRAGERFARMCHTIDDLLTKSPMIDRMLFSKI